VCYPAWQHGALCALAGSEKAPLESARRASQALERVLEITFGTKSNQLPSKRDIEP
jgi:hypothetical protein